MKHEKKLNRSFSENRQTAEERFQEKLLHNNLSESERIQINQALRALCEINHILIHNEDETAILQNACRIILRSGYTFVWIAIKENNTEKVNNFFGCAKPEFDRKYSELIRADDKSEYGPCKTAIHTGKPIVINENTSSETGLKWLDKIKSFNLKSVASFPLNNNGSVLGAVTIYSSLKNRFEDTDEIVILKELAGDMFAGISSIRMKSEKELLEDALRKCEQRQITLIQKIQVAIIVHGIDTKIVMSNQKAQELLGYTEKELQNKKASDFSEHFFYEDNSPIPVENFPVMQVLSKNEVVRNLTTRIHRPNNENDIWVLVNADPIFDHGDIIAQVIVTLIDITDRKTAEEDLQKSKKNLNLTLEAAGIGYWEWNIKNNRLYSTPVCYTMLGYKPITEYTDGKNWFDMVHPDDRGFVWKNLQKAMSRNFKEYEYEARVKTSNGTYRWILSKGFGFEYDENGLVTRMTGIRTDIHQRKIAEQEHLASIRFFKSMDIINEAIRKTDNIEQMMSDVLDKMLEIFSSDRAWLFYPCDPSATHWRVPIMRNNPNFPVTPLIKNEIPMDSITSDYLKIICGADGRPVTFGPEADYPLNKEFAKKHNYLSQIVMAVKPRINKPWVLGMHQCSFERIWTQEEKNLFLEIGRRLSDGLTTFLTFRNLQESEAKYRRIVDTTNEGIWMIDQNSFTTFVNKRMAEMLGYTIEELMDHPATNFMFDEDITDHNKKIERQKNGISDIYEQRLRQKNGGPVFTLLSATPVFDEEGVFIGSFGMLTDITQRKKTEEILRKKEEQLRITLELAHVGVWDWDLKNDLVFATPVYYAILGYQPKSEPGHIKEWLNRVHPDDYDKVKQQFDNALSQKVSEYKYDARFKQPDGTYRWIHSEGFGFEHDHNGLVTRMIGIRLDINDRKIAEQEHLGTIRFFKSMDMVNQAIRKTNDLEQMMSGVLDTMLSIFDAEQAVLIYPCDPETSSWQVPMERAKPGFYGKVYTNKLIMPNSKDVAFIFDKLIDSGDKPLTIGPEADFPIEKEFTQKFHVLSQISMAVFPKIGKPWELTIDQQSYARVWTLEEKNLFQEIGRRLSDGLTTLLIFRDLQDSEAKYRRIVDTSNEGIWMIDENYKTTYANTKMAEMLGYKTDELIKSTPMDFMFKEDIEDHWKKIINRKKGLAEVYERRLCHKKGYQVWTLTSSTPIFDAQKNFKGTLAMVTDITQRKIAEEKLKESEERLRITLEAAQIGVWDWDLVQDLMYVTPSSYTTLGYLPKDELVGINDWMSLIHPEDQIKLKKAIDDLYYSKLTHGRGYEVRYRHKNGTYRWMLVQGFIVNRDTDGSITRIVGVRIDIDERKKAEEELKKYQEHLKDLVETRTKELSETNTKLQIAKEAAEAASKAKSRFLANMSHELRTPLNAILGYAQIFEHDKTLSEQQKSGIKIIKKSGEHLLTLISDILDLSRIEAQKFKLHPSGINLQFFFEAIKDVIQIKAESKQLSVYFNLEKDLPSGIIADETRLRQVLINLLGNAVKFTDSGYVKCNVSVLSYQKEKKQIPQQCTIRFEVKDTGSGIKHDQLENIFSPFEQVSEIAVKEGTGLGLSISRQLIQMMGGEISVESELGKGSRFWFDLTFPVLTVPVTLKETEKTVIGYKGLRKKVLIADDNQTNRQLLTEWFSQLGFNTYEAENGVQAISSAQQFQPDIIIMDLRMPGMSGFEAASKIRVIPTTSQIVIIAVSASIANITDEQYKTAGFNDLLLKPIDFVKLSDSISKFIQIEWVYETPAKAEEIVEPILPPPPQELQILHQLIKQGDMLQLSDRAQHIETLGKQYIPFARKLKSLAENFEEHQIEKLIEDALKDHDNS